MPLSFLYVSSGMCTVQSMFKLSYVDLDLVKPLLRRSCGPVSGEGFGTLWFSGFR